MNERTNEVPGVRSPDLPGPRGASNAIYWWFDQVGSFLVLPGKEVSVGSAGSQEATIGLMADVSSIHLILKREGERFYLNPVRPVKVNGDLTDGLLLKDGDRIQLGKAQLAFDQPVPWSGTARLRLVSGHRLSTSVDAILLMGETCLIGPATNAHVAVDADAGTGQIRHRNGRFWIRGSSPVTVNEASNDGWMAMPAVANVRGPWGRFRWEPRGNGPAARRGSDA